MATRREQQKKYGFKAEKVKKNIARGSSNSGSNYLKLPDNIDWFKPVYKEGKTTAVYLLNVIPFLSCKYNPETESEGDLWYRSKYRRGQLPDGSKFVSPSTFGEACPMSEMYFEMKDNPDIGKKELEALSVKSRELYYVIDIKEDKPKIRLIDMSYFLFGKILDTEMESEEYEDEPFDPAEFADPDPSVGCTLKITFEQDKFQGHDYSKVSKISFVPKKGKVITDKLIESLEDPLMLLERMSYKQVKAAMAANDHVSGGEDEEASTIPMDYDDEDDAADASTEVDLDDMDRSELKAYIKEEGLDIKVTTSMSDQDIRDAIEEALSEAEESEEDDEDTEIEENDDDDFFEVE